MQNARVKYLPGADTNITVTRDIRVHIQPLARVRKPTLLQKLSAWWDKEMYEDPETKAWAEADTPEKIISLVFKDDGLEG